MAVSFLLFTVFNAAVSLSPNIGALLALRFISGSSCSFRSLALRLD